jgi:hypothetical protein
MQPFPSIMILCMKLFYSSLQVGQNKLECLPVNFFQASSMFVMRPGSLFHKTHYGRNFRFP